VTGNHDVSLGGVLRAWLIGPVIDLLLLIHKDIHMNNDQMLARLASVDETLANVADGVVKISGETDSLQVEIAVLKDQIAAAGGTTPEVDAALAAVEARIGSITTGVAALDAKVPDAPPPPAP
jgi:hypothetical protein